MTGEDHAAALEAADRDLLEAFAKMPDALEDVRRESSASEVRWKRARTFVVAFVTSHRLELAIDLLRKADHPLVIGREKTTKRVVTHRLRVETASDLDGSIRDLVVEAWETVGPGTRKS